MVGKCKARLRLPRGLGVLECAALPRTQHARSPHVSGTSCSCLFPCVVMSLHPLSAKSMNTDFAVTELPLPFGPALCDADAACQAFCTHSQVVMSTCAIVVYGRVLHLVIPLEHCEGKLLGQLPAVCLYVR